MVRHPSLRNAGYRPTIVRLARTELSRRTVKRISRGLENQYPTVDLEQQGPPVRFERPTAVVHAPGIGSRHRLQPGGGFLLPSATFADLDLRQWTPSALAGPCSRAGADTGGRVFPLSVAVLARAQHVPDDRQRSDQQHAKDDPAADPVHWTSPVGVLWRAISVDCVSYKDASAKQT
jgi:hypothetical protein